MGRFISGPADRDAPLVPLLIALTVVTGLVDAASYLLLGHVFVANMTGNVVFIGFALAGAQGFSLAASLLALLAFGIGGIAGGRIGRATPSRARALWTGVASEAGLFALAALTVGLDLPLEQSWAAYLVIGLLGLAMGIQNAVVRGLGVRDLTTTVLTLTITGLTAESSAAGGNNAAWGRRVASIASMALGALVGTLIVLHAPPLVAILVPLAGIVLIAAVAFRLM